MSPKPKIGMSLYSYGASIMTQKMTIKECIEHSASLGVEGIEFVDNRHIPSYPYHSAYDLQELREYVESFGMKVSSYSVYMRKAHGESSLEEIVRLFKKQVVEAKILGAKLIRGGIFAPGRFGRNTASARDYILRMTKKFFHQVLPDLKKNGIVLGVEIHAPYTSDFYLRLVKEINSEYLRLVPDFSVWQTRGIPGASGGEPIDSFKQCIPYTIHVHAKAHTFDENGEEPGTPYAQLIAALKEGNFDGYISAEYEGWSLGDFTDSRITAKKHIELIKKYLL